MHALVFDIVGVSFTVGVYLLYHGILAVMVKRKPMRTAIGQYIAHRKNWVRVVVEGRKDILAVQTLRKRTHNCSRHTTHHPLSVSIC